MLENNSRLIEIKQKYNKYFHINWNITNKCNFSCEYCHPYNYEGSSEAYKLETYKQFVTKVKESIDIDEELIISFTGGEPTAMPIFDEFLTWLVEQDVQVGLTTNGSKNIKFWEKHKNSFRWISFSFHSEQTNIKHCVKVIDTLWQHTMMSVRIMMHPKEEYFNKCIEFFEILKTQPHMLDSTVPTTHNNEFFVEKVPIIADWLTITERPHVYTPEQQARINEQLSYTRSTTTPVIGYDQYQMPIDVAPVYQLPDGRYIEGDILNTNELYTSHNNKFKDWTCNAGIDGLFVNERGYISGAACLPEEKDETGEIMWLGHLENIDDFNLPTKAYICKKTACFCNTDIILSKKRPNDDR